MDGNHGPDVAQSAGVAVTEVGRALAAVRPARDSAGLIGQLRGLEDLKSEVSD